MSQAWRCHLCGSLDDDDAAEREGMNCRACGSTWRHRAIALAITVGLELPFEPLADLAPDWSRRGLGLSDAMPLAAMLSSRFDYVNSWYDRFPRVDLTDVPKELHEEFEFVTCSDVLEHVPPPVDRAIDGLAALVRPGGFAAVSVPGVPELTVEYYAGLTAFELDGDTVRWWDDTGAEHLDDSPEFHLGQGQTLAFRCWGMADLARRLAAAGFSAPLDIPWVSRFGVPEIAEGNVIVVRRLPG